MYNNTNQSSSWADDYNLLGWLFILLFPVILLGIIAAQCDKDKARLSAYEDLLQEQKAQAFSNCLVDLGIQQIEHCQNRGWTAYVKAVK